MCLLGAAILTRTTRSMTSSSIGYSSLTSGCDHSLTIAPQQQRCAPSTITPSQSNMSSRHISCVPLHPSTCPSGTTYLLFSQTTLTFCFLGFLVYISMDNLLWWTWHCPQRYKTGKSRIVATIFQFYASMDSAMSLLRHISSRVERLSARSRNASEHASFFREHPF